MIDIIAPVVHHVAHLLERSRVRVVGNRAVRIRFMRRSGRRACVSGSRVYVSKREREREREREKKTRLRIAPGCDIRTGVQPPPALQFIIALSVPRRLIAVPYGENKCTMQRRRGRREERKRGGEGAAGAT